jgi:hypothetical protein
MLRFIRNFSSFYIVPWTWTIRESVIRLNDSSTYSYCQKSYQRNTNICNVFKCNILITYIYLIHRCSQCHEPVCGLCYLSEMCLIDKSCLGLLFIIIAFSLYSHFFMKIIQFVIVWTFLAFFYHRADFFCAHYHIAWHFDVWVFIYIYIYRIYVSTAQTLAP